MNTILRFFANTIIMVLVPMSFVFVVKKENHERYVTSRKISVLSTRKYDIVVSTFYYAEKKQTDDTPFITANGFLINENNPYSDRIIAVSRDLEKNYPLGSKIRVSFYNNKKCKIYDGIYMVNDRMNKRIINTIDILVNKGMFIDKCKRVYIEKVNN